MRILGKYYFTRGGKTFRAFTLGVMADGTVCVERKHPGKDSHLSRKRGVKYLSSKEKFVPDWKDSLEYLGCTVLNDPLAPCKKEETDPERTIQLPEKNCRIIIHVFIVKHGHEKEIENYHMLEGTSVATCLEKKITPQIGIIVKVI